MNINKFIALLSFVFLFALVTSGQDDHLSPSQKKCGSHFKKGMSIAAAMKMVTPPNECTFLEQARKKFQVVCHIAKDSVSDVYATTPDFIQESFDSLSAIFSPIDMSFTICEVDSLANTRYFDWIQVQDESHALVYNYLPNAINIYFCNSVFSEEEGFVGGYAMFPGGSDIIVMSCNDGEFSLLTLAHEIGHFFGLFHTFETENGVELADGSNCEDSGDLICDTDADPQGFTSVDCEFMGPLQDSQGNWYTPPIDNIMSYYNDDCICEFTLQQYNRMVEIYRNERNYLW